MEPLGVMGRWGVGMKGFWTVEIQTQSTKLLLLK